MESDSDDSDSGNICPICGRNFETMAGIKQHWAKGHSISEFQAAIEARSQQSNLDAILGSSTYSQAPLVRPPSPIISQTMGIPPSDMLRNRATCDVCGFLAKNQRGLNVHARTHDNHPVAVASDSATRQIHIDYSDEARLIRKFGELIYKCKCNIPLVRIIQKSVRTAVCQEFTKVVEIAAVKNDILSWFRLLSFPIIVLNQVSKNAFKDNRRPNIIRYNLGVFSKLVDIPSLINELLTLLSIDLPKKPISQTEKLIIKIALRKIAEGDIGGAVRVLSSQEGMADYTPETIEKLKSKHPHEDSSSDTVVTPNQEQFETSSEQIINAIRHFPISSSGGIDGLRPRHLKDLISFSCGEISKKLTAAMAKLVNIIRAGKLCEKLVPIFYGAALIALAKENGDIRPTAIGLTWRRLAGKIGCFSIRDELSQQLAPIQNGFGVKGGAESIVHAGRAFASADHILPTAIIKLDFKNAFNEVLRRYLLGEIKREAPSLFPMLKQAYSTPSDLFFGDTIIESQRGTQQGDPCAPAGFCIGMKKLTHSLTSTLNAWFLDDGTIGDKFDIVLNDVVRVLAFSDESGLSLNPAKCEVFFVNATSTEQSDMMGRLNRLLPGIKRINAASFKLLGAPIFDDAINDMLSAGLKNVKSMCKRLSLIDIHPALRVLRCSLATPRFQYLLRTSPTFQKPNMLNEIDEFYRSTLEAITNNGLNETAWTQASLPLSASGLGIRKLTDLAHPAYFSSVFQSESLSNQILANANLCVFNRNLQSLLDEFPPELTPASLESKKLQKCWDSLRVKTIYEELLSSSNPTDRARLLATSSETSSKWLQAVPSHQLGLLLDNDAARIAVAIRLGTKTCESHQCVCGATVESNGHHGLSCIKMLAKYGRHAEINRIISMAFTAAGFPNTTEPPGLSRSDGKRPDGLTSYPWSRGKSLIWDVTIVDTVAASYRNMTSINCGAAADQAERDKHNHHRQLKEQYVFTPLAFESFGSIGPETDLFLKKLGKLMKRNTGEPRSLDFLLQRISIAIQRGNAASIRNTYCDNGPNIFL